jgi:hypothetical protein
MVIAALDGDATLYPLNGVVGFPSDPVVLVAGEYPGTVRTTVAPDIALKELSPTKILKVLMFALAIPVSAISANNTAMIMILLV